MSKTKRLDPVKSSLAKPGELHPYISKRKIQKAREQHIRNKTLQTTNTLPLTISETVEPILELDLKETTPKEGDTTAPTKVDTLP